jgi:uncharacterized protein (DUF342 family)
MHCECMCATLKATENKATVIGGHISAYKCVEAFQIGNDNGIPTHVALVDRQKMEADEKLRDLTALRDKINKDLEPIRRELKAKATIMKKLDRTLSDKTKTILQKWVVSYNSLNNKLMYVEKNIAKLQEILKKPTLSDGFVKVTGDIYNGVDLDFYGYMKKIKGRMSDRIFRIKDGEVEA